MDSTWKTVRVFVSSTLRDMHSERDYLVKRVFPTLRERLESHRVHLIDIDLRWGVTKEQAENDQVLDVCLAQVDECRPFFVGILGERYGWVPRRIPEHVTSRWGWIQHHTGKSITELEILYGVLNNPSMHSYAFFFFRDPSFLSHVPVATRGELQAEDNESATKLASLKEAIRGAHLPVSPVETYPCRYAGLRIDRRLARMELSEAELYGLDRVAPDGLVAPGDYGTLDDRLRETVDRIGVVQLAGLEYFGDRVLNVLWQAIKVEYHLPDQPALVGPPEAEPGDAEEHHHDRFMESRLRVYVGRDALQGSLEEFVDGDEHVPCLVTGPSGAGKSAALARFVASYRATHPDRIMISHFVGASPASSNLRLMLRRICSSIRETFLDLFENQKRERLATLVENDAESARQRLVVAREYEVPEDTNRLAATLDRWIRTVPRTRRVVLVLDALDQLEEVDDAQNLYWLPRDLPSNVKLILSCISDPENNEPGLDALDRRPCRRIEVQPLADAERRAIVHAVPSLSAKTLDEAQIGLLLDNPATTTPLFLLVALEELRGFGSFEQLTRRIEILPSGGDTVTAIFLQVLERLEEDFDSALVRSLLSLLASTRRGLAEREVLDLLERPTADVSESTSDLFPVLRQLRPYLQYRGRLLAFYHRNLFKAVRNRYLATRVATRAAHARLSDYFGVKAYEQGPSGESGFVAASRSLPDVWNRTRGLDELPWQLIHAEEWPAVESLLTNLAFVDAKCKYGMSYDVTADYDLAMRYWPGQGSQSEETRAWQRTIAKYTEDMWAYVKEWRDACDRHELSRGSVPLSSDEHIPRPSPPHLASSDSSEGARGNSDIASQPPLGRIAAWAHFARHYGRDLARGEEPAFQLAYNCASPGPVQTNMDARLSRKEYPPNGWIRVLNRQPARGLKSCIAVLQGHSEDVCAVAFAADAERVISGSIDGEIRVWRLDSGQCEQIIYSQVWRQSVGVGSWGGVGFGNRLALVSVPELALISTSFGGVFTRLPSAWQELIGRFGEVTGRFVHPSGGEGELTPDLIGELVAITANGALGISIMRTPRAVVEESGFRVVRQAVHLWDLRHGSYLRRIAHGKQFLRRAVFTVDGEFVILAGVDELHGLLSDHMIEVWATTSGSRVAALKGHNGPVNAIAVSADGRILISGSGGPEGRGWAPSTDNSVRVWDLVSQECLHVLEGHTGSVQDVAVTPDGRLIASASQDGSVRVWDLAVPQQSRRLQKHVGRVMSVDTDRCANIAATGGWEGAVLVWDASVGDVQRGLLDEAAVVGAVSVSSEAGVIATGWWNGRVNLWDPGGQLLWSSEEHAKGVLSLAQTSDGSRIISGGRDGTIAVYERSSGRRIMRLNSGSPVTRLCTTPDGRVVLSSHNSLEWLEWDQDSSMGIGEELCVRIWDLANGTLLARLPGNIVVPTPHGNLVVVAQDGDRIGDSLFGVRAFRLAGELYADFQGPHAVTSLAVTPDGERVIAGDSRGAVWLWDWGFPEAGQRVEAHAGSVRGLAVSSDAQYVVSVGSDQRVCLFRLATQQLICRFDARDHVRAIGALSADNRLVLGLENGTVLFLRIEVPSRQPSIITACRRWLFDDEHGSSGWESTLTATCPRCNRRVVVLEKDLAKTIDCTCGERLSLSPVACDNSRASGVS